MKKRPPLPRPDELKRCEECGKVLGDFKGWYGAQCMCNAPKGAGPETAHSIGTGTRRD